MINVISSVKIKDGKISEFIDVFKSFAEKVKKQKGCIEYFPAVDAKTDFPPQISNEGSVTIIEKWETMEDFMDHVSDPGLQEQQKKEEGLVEGAEIRILQGV